MKNYQTPSLEILAICEEDVIATSTLILELEDDDVLLRAEI